MQLQLPLSDEAYYAIGANVAHPSQRTAKAVYDGFGISNTAVFPTNQGIGSYLDRFCALLLHPNTFIDARPPHIKTEPLSRPHMLNWHEVIPPPSPIRSPNNPAQILAHITCAEGPVCMLTSPFDMEAATTPFATEERWKFGPANEWKDQWFDTSRHDMQVRYVRLEALTVDYLYMVAVWWRIPAASVASLTRTESTPAARIAGVLEAIGTGWLKHPELKKETVQDKRREYMRKWRATRYN